MSKPAFAACLLIVAGCATSVRSTGPAPVSPDARAVRDITLHSARFGTGNTFADVTKRVAELLRQHDFAGIQARVDWLRVDPIPGKTKVLILHYAYRGQERMYVVTGDQRATYDMLVAVPTP